MTAYDLRTRLAGVGVDLSADGDDLVADGEVPPDAIPALELLRAPLVSLLTDRTLYAFLVGGKPYGGDGILSPRELLPLDVRLLCAAGGQWDIVSPAARLRFPAMFAEKGGNR